MATDKDHRRDPEITVGMWSSGTPTVVWRVRQYGNAISVLNQSPDTLNSMYSSQ